MAKIAASSMKSPIFTAARAYIELSLACGSLDSRGVLCQKVGLCLLFFISQARIWDPPTPGHMILGLTPSAGAFLLPDTRQLLKLLHCNRQTSVPWSCNRGGKLHNLLQLRLRSLHSGVVQLSVRAPMGVRRYQIVELEFHVVLWLGVRVSART